MKAFSIVLMVFLVSGWWSSVAYKKLESSKNQSLLRTVVIDPGHGGKDLGSRGANSTEKDIALSVSFLLGAIIQANHPDINVVYTRYRDEFVTLVKRADIANKSKGDLFISIHCNAFRNNPEIKGVETYVLGIAPNDISDVAKQENEVIYLEDEFEKNYGIDPNTPQGMIKFGMYQDAFLAQSITLAGFIQNQVKSYTGRKTRLIKQDAFMVLRLSNMPSVLVEMGFVSNPEEESYLVSQEGQNEMAMSLYLAFRDYKNTLEGIPVGY